MKKNLLFTTIFLMVFLSVNLRAQLTPQDAILSMGRGINMGNTLEPPNGEGTWGNPAATASNFDDYKNAGFRCVRLPITWDKHGDTTSPYTINATWLNRIEQIVDWALSRQLIVIINAHHESWIKEAYTPEHIARFDSIWSQIATRFQNKSDSLLFEMINEPYPLSLANVNALNARTLATIRKTNPTRIVLFSGHQWSNSQELLQAAIPDTSDKHLIGYYHSYDPYPFGLVGTGTYGSDADIATTTTKFQQVSNWSATKKIPVVLGEYGFTKVCEYNSRMCAYATVVEKAQLYNVPAMVWEDGGDFFFYDRTAHTWNEIKDILIHTYKESPNKMKISAYADSSLKIQWKNRTAENDSIIVERKVDDGDFSFFAKIAPTDSIFIDSTTSRGKAFYYRLRANFKDSIEIQSYPVMMRILPASREPFTGIPAPIPGTIEAENYDIGGEGLTFHDTDNINEGGNNYRSGDGVDIGEHAAGELHVGYIAAGEWLEYTVDVQQAATYTITAAVASGGTGGGKFNMKFSKSATATPTLTTVATGSWTTYTTISTTFKLDTGIQTMRINMTNAGFDLDYVDFSIPTFVGEPAAPLHFKLFDNYPNPFNPSTTIAFDLPSKSFVTLKIYDLLGREVKTLVEGVMESGHHTQQWNAGTFASGIYFYRLQAGFNTNTKRLVLLR
jgi:hypothetical protein